MHAGTEERVRRCEQCSFYSKAVELRGLALSTSYFLLKGCPGTLVFPLPWPPVIASTVLWLTGAFSAASLALKSYTGSAPGMPAVPSQNSLPQAVSASAGDTCVPFSRALGKQGPLCNQSQGLFFLVAVFALICSLGRTEDVIPVRSANQVQEPGKCKWKLLQQHSRWLFLCHGPKSLPPLTETQLRLLQTHKLLGSPIHFPHCALFYCIE